MVQPRQYVLTVETPQAMPKDGADFEIHAVFFVRLVDDGCNNEASLQQ
jgi:hypothetical protein